MRATELIRAVLDLLDQHEQHDQEMYGQEEPERYTQDDEQARFNQILSILQTKDMPTPCANTPNEVVAPVDAVTTLAGGGVNGPKHPHDIRVKDPSQHPGQQEY